MDFIQSVNTLVDDILVDDPIDWGMLSVDEDDAKKLIVMNMAQHVRDLLAEAQSQHEIVVSLTAIASKLALENFCLHARMLQNAGSN